MIRPMPRPARAAVSAALLLALSATATLASAGKFHEVTWPANDNPGKMPLGVTYTLWIPEGVKTLRGVIVHQHGCGTGACKGGATAAYDLHWQALARKWDCALLGPSYHQDDKQNCRLWCDPRNGSEKTFLAALEHFADKAGRPELRTAPWCLWGHSGGGFWASLMQTLHPDRIVACWLRSGTAYSAWEAGQIPRPEIPEAAYAVPVMCNPGGKEKGDKRFNGAWVGSTAMFQAYRAKGAPISFASDPRTSHECGDSRYLAIPFFDACLAQRLPPAGSPADAKLRPVDWKAAHLADAPGETAIATAAPVAAPAADYKGKPESAVWLPDAKTAKAWAEYVHKGATADDTPPPAPTGVTVTAGADGSVEVRWDADADFESGLRGFVVLRDGKEVAVLPEKPVGKFGRPLWQVMSYHDTPEKPLPEMKFVDKTPAPGGKAEYRIIAVNGTGLRSEASGIGK